MEGKEGKKEYGRTEWDSKLGRVYISNGVSVSGRAKKRTSALSPVSYLLYIFVTLLIYVQVSTEVPNDHHW